MIKLRLSTAARDGTSLAVKKSVSANPFFNPDEPGFIVKRFIDAKITLVPTLTHHIPLRVLSEQIQDTADVDRQELHENLDRALRIIEYAAPEETVRASPTSGYTIMMAIVGVFYGFSLLGCGWLIIMTSLKAS